MAKLFDDRSPTRPGCVDCEGDGLSASSTLSGTVAAIVRREKGRVVAALVRRLGSIDAAEEAFQEAVLAALPSWRNGLPTNPAAWLTTAAKNHARDTARHRRIVEAKSPLLSEQDMTSPELPDSISDEQLRLIFTCCHPALTLDSQVALTLKVVAGLSTEEIARAFLCPEKTVSQRITRAKKTIEERQLPYEVPDRTELAERLGPVLAVIYLIFNEGHTTREGALMRVDLQTEALRLARLLCDLLPNESEVFGLFALIALSLARADTRMDERGDLLLLSEQDRSRWDRRAIKEGLLALQRASRLGGSGPYAVQAAISACHATAPTWADTAWDRILRLYDELLALAPSPVVALNRAVAVCMHRGPAAGLDALSQLEAALSNYHLFFALRADFRSRVGESAVGDYERALALASNESERRFLRRKIDQLGRAM
jgi:RNA polymerase sigma-70 factor (ECF subfamily)